jgi:uncharacterized repeat protein (TIGR03803 family)
MKAVRFSVALAAVLACAGCGGGDSSQPVTTPAPVPTPTPTPAPTPTPTPTPSATATYLHIFAISETDGAQPNGPPLQASDGKFYGTTRNGGANKCRPVSEIPCGVIYRVNSAGDYELLHQFSASGAEGYTALSALIEGPNGALYGTTAGGGAYGGGVVFQIGLDGAYRVLHSFGGTSDEGNTLTSALVLGKDENLYGVTSSGANNCVQIPKAGGNCGTIFRLTRDGAMKTLYSFGDTPNGGVQPNGPLVQAPDGTFYGTTSLGGLYDRGTIFKLGTDGRLTTIHSFGATGLDPSSPQGSLVFGTDGALYGTTPSGGAGNGTVYRLDAAERVTVVRAFGKDGVIDGQGPAAFLTVGRDGQLYGTTRNGGPNGGGTAFRLTYAGSLTTLFSFGTGQNQPHDPEMGLIQGKDGALYGTTFYNEGLGMISPRLGFGAFYKLELP